MVPKRITSLQHPLVKHWLELRLTRSYREEKKRLLISGERMVLEGEVDVLISLEPSNIEAKEKYLVSEAILKKITGLNQPDGVAAEVFLPPPQNLRGKKFLVILDKIADPGNLGTILRTALALNWEGVIVTPGTVDLFNDKALRAGKGAHFHLPYARMSPEEILQLDLHLYTADLEGEALENSSFKEPLGLILSNEAHGPGDWAAKKITIAMNPNVESLNVASSGSILLYAMRPK
jgi:TrmH family RNA methyltransferase